jgi:hypothetical protein
VLGILTCPKEQNGRLYFPAQHATPPVRRRRSNAVSEPMKIDEAKDRVFIHNLDDEVSDTESEDERLVFLPDIEKRLTKIPKSVLVGQSGPHANNEIVLYGVPESLSVPPEQDNVRRAIIEARARAREKQVKDYESSRKSDGGPGPTPASSPDPSCLGPGTQSPLHPLATNTHDEDAMDIG